MWPFGPIDSNYLGNTPLASKYFNPDYLGSHLWEFLKIIFYDAWSWETISGIYTLMSLFAVFFIALIMYCMIRLFEIRKKEREHLAHEIEEYAKHQREKEKAARESQSVSRNERWVKTLEYLFSDSQSDWKLAIIEADSMLEALLEQLGFVGENMGVRLRSVDQSRFRYLPLAWEAHTVRNRIAHEGSAFVISHHEAKRVVGMYEQIFRLYGYI